MDGKEAGAVYLHLGQSVVVPHSQILGVFDLDNASWATKDRGRSSPSQTTLPACSARSRYSRVL